MEKKMGGVVSDMPLAPAEGTAAPLASSAAVAPPPSSPVPLALVGVAAAPLVSSATVAPPPSSPVPLALVGVAAAPRASSRVVAPRTAWPASLDHEQREKSFTANYQQWEVTRAMIQHEDGLVHQRMTSYLTTQGFLLAAFGVLTNAWLGRSDHAEFRMFIPAVVVLSAFCFIAITTAFHTKDAVDAAVKQIGRTVRWWMQYSGEGLPSSDPGLPDLVADRPFPPVIGQLPSGMVIDRHILYLSCAWTALWAAVVGAVIYRYFSRANVPEDLRLLWATLGALGWAVVGVLLCVRRWAKGQLPPSAETHIPTAKS